LGEIRINLTPKDERKYQSHEIALRIRKDLEAIAEKLGADLAIVESPPGPPVIATVVAEIYGDASTEYSELVQTADQVEGWMKKEPGLVDIQSTTDAPRNRWDYVVNREKAALHGVNDQTLTHTLALALKGGQPGTLSISHERNPMRIQLIAQREERSSILDLEKLQVPTATGEMVELAELGSFESVPESQPIYHKNLQRVVYVMAEMAGRAPGEAILDLGGVMKDDPTPKGIRVNWAGEGEWFITIRVFRDLGLAFGAAMIGIYILLVVQTKSFLMPMVIMSAIPMTAIGVMPGFWILNMILDRPVGGFDNPVFFTATAMIGMIALGGIVVRNSIVLIEFIQDSIKSGESIQESILFSGAVRMRPILLTAATTALGAWPITYDPIFSGLAWALIFGLFASTAFTLVVVPTLYGMIYGGTTQKK
jgi:multidrug efflux pump subunit AcrB